MNATWGGGSSIVLSKALNAEFDSMCASSMMKILYRSRVGASATVSMITSRTSSTPVCDAASISSTSRLEDKAISRHDTHSSQGVGVGPFTQFSDLARMRAVVVLPQPRGPVKR